MSPRLQELATVVRGYLLEMSLDAQPSDDGLLFFKYGSTAVMVRLFEAEDLTFVRFVSTLLTDVARTPNLVDTVLRLNTEVLMGAFLLFEDDTLAFACTLLGNQLDLEEFETALRYVAQVSDDFDDVLQALAGGQRAEDLFEDS